MTDYKQKWRLGLIRGSDIGHRSDQQVPLCHGWNAFAAVVCISAITVFEFSHQRPATAREEKKKNPKPSPHQKPATLSSLNSTQ